MRAGRIDRLSGPESTGYKQPKGARDGEEKQIVNSGILVPYLYTEWLRHGVKHGGYVTKNGSTG